MKFRDKTIADNNNKNSQIGSPSIDVKNTPPNFEICFEYQIALKLIER